MFTKGPSGTREILPFPVDTFPVRAVPGNQWSGSLAAFVRHFREGERGAHDRYRRTKENEVTRDERQEVGVP